MDEKFTELFLKHKMKIRNNLCLIIGSSDVDDLIQDAAIKALKVFRDGGFNEGGNFTAWMTQIAKNLFIDGTRKKSPIELKEWDAPVEEVEDDEDRLILMKSLIEKLPPKYQFIIRLRLEGKRFTEIADDTGIDFNTAKVMSHKAIQKMKDMLIAP